MDSHILTHPTECIHCTLIDHSTAELRSPTMKRGISDAPEPGVLQLPFQEMQSSTETQNHTATVLYKTVFCSSSENRRISDRGGVRSAPDRKDVRLSRNRLQCSQTCSTPCAADRTTQSPMCPSHANWRRKDARYRLPISPNSAPTSERSRHHASSMRSRHTSVSPPNTSIPQPPQEKGTPASPTLPPSTNCSIRPCDAYSRVLRTCLPPRNICSLNSPTAFERPKACRYAAPTHRLLRWGNTPSEGTDHFTSEQASFSVYGESIERGGALKSIAPACSAPDGAAELNHAT